MERLVKLANAVKLGLGVTGRCHLRHQDQERLLTRPVVLGDETANRDCQWCVNCIMQGHEHLPIQQRRNVYCKP